MTLEESVEAESDPDEELHAARHADVTNPANNTSPVDLSHPLFDVAELPRRLVGACPSPPPVVDPQGLLETIADNLNENGSRCKWGWLS
jgi:hypothetical protein